MKNDKHFQAQADRIISGLPPKLNDLVQQYHIWKKLNLYFRQELLKAYNQGVRDEAKRIAQAHDQEIL